VRGALSARPVAPRRRRRARPVASWPELAAPHAAAACAGARLDSRPAGRARRRPRSRRVALAAGPLAGAAGAASDAAAHPSAAAAAAAAGGEYIS